MFVGEDYARTLELFSHEAPYLIRRIIAINSRVFGGYNAGNIEGNVVTSVYVFSLIELRDLFKRGLYLVIAVKPSTHHQTAN